MNPSHSGLNISPELAVAIRALYQQLEAPIAGGLIDSPPVDHPSPEAVHTSGKHLHANGSNGHHVHHGHKDVLVRTTTDPVLPTLRTDVPAGYTHVGPILLFGTLMADLYSADGLVTGHRECVLLKASSIPDIFKAVPQLQSFTVTDLYFEYTQTSVLPDIVAGCFLKCNIGLSGKLAEVISVIEPVLGIHTTTLPFKAKTSDLRTWAVPISTEDLTFETDLGSGQDAVASGLLSFQKNKFTCTIGPSAAPTNLLYSGDAQLYTDPVVAPTSFIAMTYSMTKNGSVADITLDCLDTGPHAFGMTALRLGDLHMAGSIDLKNPKGSLDMTLAATILLSTSQPSVQVNGHFSLADWSMSFRAANWTFADVITFQQGLYGVSLATFDPKVTINQPQLVIAKGKGITVTADLQVEEFTAAAAVIQINSLGLTIAGSVPDFKVYGPITLTGVQLAIFIHAKIKGDPDREVDFTLKGVVHMGQSTIQAGMYIDKLPNGSGTVKTVYGVFDASFVISDLVAPLKGSFADKITLKDVALIYTDAPDGTDLSAVSAPIPQGYTLQNGLQVAAHLTSSLDLLDRFMKNTRPTTNMTLQATYSESSGFELAIVLAVPQTQSLKGGQVQSGAVEVAIAYENNTPMLQIIAMYNIQLPHGGPILHADAMFKVTPISASLSVELHNTYWQNPFGISPKLIFGPDMALEIGGDFGSPIWPSELGLEFDVMVGNTVGKAALEFSDNPAQELVAVSIKELGLKELVTFAGTLFGKNWSLENDDILLIQDFDLYLSSGVTLGLTSYPAGAGFEASVILFGKHGSISCRIDKETKDIKASGEVDSLQIGPVTLTGSKPGSSPSFDFDFGEHIQKFGLDGGFHIEAIHLDLDAHVEMTLGSNPVFVLRASFDWDARLQVELLATTSPSKGLERLKNLPDLKFAIDFTLQQDILDSFVKLLEKELAAAKQLADKGIDAAKAELEKEKQIANDKVAAAASDLNRLERALDAKRAIIRTDLDRLNREDGQKLKDLQQTMIRANAALQAKIDVAEDHLRMVQEQGQKSIDAAQQNLDHAQRQGVADVQSARDRVTAADHELNSKFGDAEGAVERAQQKVDDAQNRYDHGHWWEKAALWIPLEVAKGVLEVAQAVLHGADYAAAKGALEIAQAALMAAQETVKVSIDVATKAVATAGDAAQLLINDAQKALEAVKTGSKELLDSVAAKKAFDEATALFQKALHDIDERFDQALADAEAAGLSVAQETLKLAQVAAEIAIHVAEKALDDAEIAIGGVLKAATWLAQHGTVFEITLLNVTGDLDGLAKKGTALDVHIEGSLAGKPFAPLTLDFVPGDSASLVHSFFKWAMVEIKKIL